MKKDVTFSLRMSREIREALGAAAREDHRSVASLMDKIVADYLVATGYLKTSGSGRDVRRFPRKPLKVPARITVSARGEENLFPIVILDISLGGVLMTYPRNSKIRLSASGRLPEFGLCVEGIQTNGNVRLDCVARHVHDTGDEIKVGAAFIEPKKEGLVILDEYLS